MPFTHEHENPPAPFNPEFRPGLGDALSKAHGAWCDANPDVTRAERAEAYKATRLGLLAQYPKVGEAGTFQGGAGYYVGNSYESHKSGTYSNAVKFAENMARRHQAEPVRISWDAHGQRFTETFVYDAARKIRPA